MVKTLGVVLDMNLMLNQHTQSVCSSIYYHSQPRRVVYSQMELLSPSTERHSITEATESSHETTLIGLTHQLDVRMLWGV